MRKKFWIVAATFVAAACAAQQEARLVDSLKAELAERSDTTRVNVLVTLANTIVPSAPAEAKQYAEEAQRLSEQLHWQTGIARSLRMQGYANYIMGDFVNALARFHDAAKAAEPLNDEKLKGTILNNTALVYNELGEFDKALENYKKFLAIAREQKLSREEAIALMNTGLVYFKQNKQQEALDYFSQSLAIAETNGHAQVAAYSLSNMGAALNKKGEYARGLESFQKSIRLADKLGDTRIKVQSLGGVGESSFHLKKYADAEGYSLQALRLAEETNLLEYQKQMYEGLTEIYAKQNTFEKAFHAHKKFVQLRDSIMNDQKRQEIRKRELQFEFDKKEAVLKAEHAAAIARQRVVRNATMGGGATLLLAALTSFAFYKKRRDADLRRKEAEFLAQVSDTEMKALRSQMNPHFIFNSLNSISDYIAKHDMPAADYFLTKFAKLMRLILENSDKKEVTLADDLHALELYLELEAARFNRKFTYEIAVDDAIDSDSTLIPPLLLQPFVENSILHGIAKKAGDGKILIRIAKEDGMIRCSVEDNGIGRKQSAAIPSEQKKQSLGIKITKARIDILNRIKQSNAKLEFTDLPEGTRVEVHLPLVLQF